MISARFLYRLLEMFPGGLLWAVFVFSIAASFWWPIAVITFVILFDVFWLLRVSYFVFYIIVALREYRRATRTDWYEKVRHEYLNWPEYYPLIFLPTYKEDAAGL